jgi:PKD domain/Carbohydrate binding domain
MNNYKCKRTYLFCLAILLVLSACADPGAHDRGGPVPVASVPASDGTNLLANSAFESGNLDGWNIDGGAAVSNAEPHAGSWSARLEHVGSGIASMEAALATNVGTSYKVTAWVKIASESGDDWGGFRIGAAGWDWKELAQTGALLKSARGSDWFKVAFTFSAATPQTRLQVGYFGGPGRDMAVQVDDIAVFAKGTNKPPEVVASLTPTSSNSLPQTQQYSLTGDDPDGAIVHVAWDFGDGVRALAPGGSRRIAIPGQYVATVRVADDDGAAVVKTIPWTASASGFPTLAIGAPAEAETTVHNATLAMIGSAGASARVQVSTDRGYAGVANGSSAWAAKVPLQPGWNRILVQASGADGPIVAAERLVRYVPSGPLRISNMAESVSSVARWDMLAVTFTLDNSAATDPQFPYDPAPPPGLEWVDGVSVEAAFTPDNWQTIYRRPAFLDQRYDRALKNNEEWMYPRGVPIWTVRFAPPTIGTWKYRIEVREARGKTQSAERIFNVVNPVGQNNHGPIRVAAHDTRYFEYADGTPFLGTGHNISFTPERFSYDAIEQFNKIGAGNQNFFRWWLGGNIWGSAWQVWRSRTLDNDGYLPATGLTLDRAYGNGLAALKLDATNPIMFQGWNTGHASVIPGHTYRVRVRWKIENVAGPLVAGQPYGATVKFVDWPEPGKTGPLPALIRHVHGDTPWHIAEGDFKAQADTLPNLALILENTTDGAAYIDEVDLYEILSGGALGPQLLRDARLNSHLTFDPRRGAALDTILAEADKRGMAFKLVISEKSEYLLNHLGADGLPDLIGGDFNRGDGTPTRRLHEYYWRHLLARFGAFRSVHSWELVNEAAPSPGEHFQLAAALATAAAADGDPHMATTSTWATLAADAWKDTGSTSISYTDFHAYVRGTGWITPQEELASDSARFFAEYDRAAHAADFGKPVVWGEIGIDGSGGPNQQDPQIANDQQGVWLHKMVWARSGPGGVYPLYWYTDQIFAKSLHPIFGAWNRFMAGVPFTNGRYQDIAAATSQPDLRVFGQKDLQAGSAYLWIDNRQDTWGAVVDGHAIPPVSGSVSIPMQQPSAAYQVTWYDTTTGQPQRTETRNADAAGNLTLQIVELRTDSAAKIARNGS